MRIVEKDNFSYRVQITYDATADKYVGSLQSVKTDMADVHNWFSQATCESNIRNEVVKWGKNRLDRIEADPGISFL